MTAAQRRPAKAAIAPAFDPEAPAWPQVAAVLGEEAATLMSRTFGGRRLYVPRTVGIHHPLTVCIGPVRAGQLCEFMGGHSVEPTLLPGKRARIVELGAAKVQKAEIARRIGCTERHVYQVLAEARGEAAATGQPGFFD
jgi:hypothetical protein